MSLVPNASFSVVFYAREISTLNGYSTLNLICVTSWSLNTDFKILWLWEFHPSWIPINIYSNSCSSIYPSFLVSIISKSVLTSSKLWSMWKNEQLKTKCSNLHFYSLRISKNLNAYALFGKFVLNLSKSFSNRTSRDEFADLANDRFYNFNNSSKLLFNSLFWSS